LKEFKEVDIRFTVDSEYGVNILQDVAVKHKVIVPVFVKIDVGLGRVGLKENDQRLLPLVQLIAKCSSLKFIGILSHAGHAYAAQTAKEIAAIAHEECQILKRVKHAIEDSGVSVSEVSVGSTPTVLASEDFEGITEIRPGNYVFLDRTQILKGFEGITRDNIALFAVSTVVSANEQYSIIDSGSKMLSSDSAPHSAGGMVGYGEVYALDHYSSKQNNRILTKLSEEHGWVGNTQEAKRLEVGSKVCVIPNHSCPAANLSDYYLVINYPSSSTSTVNTPVTVTVTWKLIARGCVQ